MSLEQQKAKKVFSDAQSTDWVGRTVAQLLDDPNIAAKAGRVIWCHDVSVAYKYFMHRLCARESLCAIHVQNKLNSAKEFVNIKAKSPMGITMA